MSLQLWSYSEYIPKKPLRANIVKVIYMENGIIGEGTHTEDEIYRPGN